MNEQNDFESHYSKSMQTVTERLTETHLEHMRTSAIGGASISLGIILLLLQTKLDSNALVVALYSSIFSIPAWVAAWQYVEAYIFYGKSSHAHFNSPKGSLVAVSFAIFGMLLLLISIVSLISYLSVFGAVLFFLLSFLLIIVVYRHNAAVSKFTENLEKNEKT
jgi:hypothetical protein